MPPFRWGIKTKDLVLFHSFYEFHSRSRRSAAVSSLSSVTLYHRFIIVERFFSPFLPHHPPNVCFCAWKEQMLSHHPFDNAAMFSARAGAFRHSPPPTEGWRSRGPIHKAGIFLCASKRSMDYVSWLFIHPGIQGCQGGDGAVASESRGSLLRSRAPVVRRSPCARHQTQSHSQICNTNQGVLMYVCSIDVSGMVYAFINRRALAWKRDIRRHLSEACQHQTRLLYLILDQCAKKAQEMSPLVASERITPMILTRKLNWCFLVFFFLVSLQPDNRRRRSSLSQELWLIYSSLSSFFRDVMS